MGSIQEDPQSPPSLYSLTPIPSKGLGLIATIPIPRGTLIVCEPALFTTESLQNANTIERDLGKIVKSLPKDPQRKFLSLHNNSPGQPNPFSNIIRSNGYPLGPNSDVGGIFLETARMNHSCCPNAQHAWNNKLQRMLVHAIRDIQEGEEITLSYIPGGPSHVRQATLKTHFGFECKCELCSLPAREREESDRRLRRAEKLDAGIGDSKRVQKSPEVVLGECRELIRIYEKEGVRDLRVARLFYDAFQICAMHSDEARAEVFARKAREERIVCEGVESEEVENLTRLAKDPKCFENWGLTTRWKTEVVDADEKMDEDWLWRAASSSR